ncbi:MAG: hypothetical protein ABUK20_02840 [Anaerolineales bacterium]|jgi:hypothetical protein
MTNPTPETPHTDAGWAKPVDTLSVKDAPSEAINLNVEGRHLSGLVHGFGQMWQKTYRVNLSGASVTPQEVIKTWKENFPKYWPEGNNLYVPLTGIQTGEVGLINLTAPGGLKLSTGIMVIYTDDVSFSFMTPEGHMFAGMLTFSAYEEDEVTTVQIQALIRASDPIYELSFRLGFGHKSEDQFWHSTLENLATEFGVQGQVQQENELIDPRMQWNEVNNVWRNAGVRSALYAPVAAVKNLLRPA